MQVFVPESRRAEIVVEVGRMEERQADPIEDTRHLEEPESNVGEGLRRSTLGGSEPAHADLKGGPLNAGSIVSGGQAPVEQTARPTHPDVNEEFSSEQAGISEGLVGVSGKIEAVKESQGVATGASQVALSASQEQEDILEAWRKRRRQELAALQGAPAGGSFHKRTPEPGAGLDQGVKRVVNQGATGLDMGDRGQGAENRPVPVRGSEEEDEELLKNLRKRLGVEPGFPGPASISTTSDPHSTLLGAPKEAPHVVSPPADFAPQLQSPETLSPDVRPTRHSFPQSPQRSHSQPIRFSSNTPPASPRRSLSPAASGGKRSASEPATSRMNPSFFPTPHSSSEPAQSDVSSPSSSPSASSHSKRSSPIEFSPPETPTSQGGPRGPIFEPPARGSGLLTAEDEALLAAMSLVGRSRSRSSPANRRLPRGGSGLPPQHVPSSQLRRAISIDPRVEARAVEKRSAERMKAVGDTTERLGVLEREESGKRLDGMQTGIVAGEAEGGPGGLSILSPERGISERGLGSDKRLKRAEGESAGGAAPAWRNTTRPGGLYSASANKGEEELDKSVAEAERVPDDVHKGAATNFEQSSGRVQLDERPDASAEAPSEEGSGRVRNVNRGLVLQILGFEDEDDLEGFGRFLSPVRTKVSDANKSRLAKKRSNSFSEFSTIPSPPQMPARARGNIEREEWSPSRGRKGFGFAGSRARKQVPMQPAVANLIAETVEDFWSSDLMGAWGMGGQSDPDASDQEPASAPGGSVGALADDFIVGLDVHSSGGESTGRETDGNKGPGPSLSHRRVVSEDFLREQGESKPGGDQLLPSAGKQSPKEGLAQSEKTLGVTVAASGAGKVTQSPDVAPELETLVKGQSEGVSEPEAPPSSNLLAGLVDQASAASGTPGEKSIGDAQHKSATSSRIGVSSSGSPRGNMESGPSSKATSSEAVSEMRPRLGPPLLDDVFEDGPEVTRLRSEIHQRDEEIRRIRASRDH